MDHRGPLRLRQQSAVNGGRCAQARAGQAPYPQGRVPCFPSALAMGFPGVTRTAGATGGAGADKETIMQDQMMCIRGRVGSDIRMHSTSGGKLIAKFRLAVPRWRYERSQDEGQGSYVEDGPTWWTVQVWDSFAHNIGYSIQKGQPVIVMGRPLANAWVGKDGELRSEVVVAASAVGHDLSKGCASFFRSPQRPPAMPPQGGAERQGRPPASDCGGQREAATTPGAAAPGGAADRSGESAGRSAAPAWDGVPQGVPGAANRTDPRTGEGAPGRQRPEGATNTRNGEGQGPSDGDRRPRPGAGAPRLVYPGPEDVVTGSSATDRSGPSGPGPARNPAGGGPAEDGRAATSGTAGRAVAAGAR